jgi:signal transduction histidine kinase
VFARSTDDRLLTGVAGAVAHRLAADPVFVRIGFIVLALASGAGVLLYLVLLALSSPPAPNPLRRLGDPIPNARRAFAFGLVVLGVMILLRGSGLWLGDSLVWPLALAALGSAVIWARGGSAVSSRSVGLTIARGAVGLLLVATGMATVLATRVSLAEAGSALVALVVAVVGVAILLAPGLLRFGRQLADERRDRIRSSERADMAAHLHDSVLHTLALIQRSDDPAEIAALARGQERELRAWLRGRADDQATLSAAIDALAGRVERHHRVPVEAVVVGDAQLDDDVRALVDAAGEAAVNAARHSGADQVSVYVEVEPDAITAYVRDDGKGFNVAEVEADRRGIAQSIVGRLQRRGGTAHVDSQPGEGTEVELRLPRRTS